MAVKTKRFIGTRKNCSCSMPGVWRAVACCKGAVVIFHSPRACAHITRNMDINAHYHSMGEGIAQQLPVVPLLSSQLEEKHSIFGGIEQLSKCIDYAVATYKPECIVIGNSCVAGVIGDDINSAARKAEESYGIPVLTVDCCGFLDGEYYQGYFDMAEVLLRRFFVKQAPEKGTALLLGDNGGPQGEFASEVKRLLTQLGVRVIGQFPAYIPIAELKDVGRAEVCIPLGGSGVTNSGLERLAELLHSEYGMQYKKDVYPLGWRQTKIWLQEMGQIFHKEEQAQHVIAQEYERLQQAIASYLPVTRGRKTVICLGRSLLYFNPDLLLEMINYMEFDIRGIVLLEGYSDVERQQLQQNLEKHGCNKIYGYQEADALFEDAELVITTHELQNRKLKQVFLPMVAKAGITGELDLLQTIYRTLSSRLIRGGVAYV